MSTLKAPPKQNVVDIIKIYTPKLTDEQAEKFDADMYKIYLAKKDAVRKSIITTCIIAISILILICYFIIQGR